MNRREPLQVLECASPLVLWRFGNGGEPTKSARGLAQSKRLPRDPKAHDPNARFMVPMRCREVVQGFHEPSKALGQMHVAYATWICPFGFMVPMHAKKRKGALLAFVSI